MIEVPDFEWITTTFTDVEGDRITRHYLINPSGQIVADVDEPCGGRLAYLTDIYKGDTMRTAWVHLGLAKSFCEETYRNSLKSAQLKSKSRIKR